MNKVSLIITVLNESESISGLLKSISKQTFLPSEVIIVDGGSKDKTIYKIKNFSKINPKLNLKIRVKVGNRSVGRNYAIKIARYGLIAITDAGCTLDKNWLKELVAVYKKSKTTVVAGYYAASGLGETLSNFQKAVVPYALVMPDKVNHKTFLPATRSMLIKKKVFVNLGGFNEKLNDNEDYDFAKRLQKEKINISFSKKAIAFWHPRKNINEFYNMIFRFARGDVFAEIVRPKVVLIFLRYFIFSFLLLLNIKLFIATMCFYFLWAVQKNKKYVDGGWKYLPLLQFISDIAVIHGSVAGFLNKKV